MEQKESTTIQRKKQQNGFLGGLAGGVVGGAVTVLLATSVLPTINVTKPTTTVQETKTTQTISNPTNITEVAQKAKNAVVSVINMQRTQNPTDLFGTRTQEQTDNLKTASEGSGVIYKVENGYAYLVTNNHVIDKQDAVEVLLADGTKEKAEVVGSDTWTDLAVLRIKADKVTTVAEFGNSDQVQVGEQAIAIGSPLGTEFATSVTSGIVSAVNRAVDTDVDNDGQKDWTMTAIQTDAAINPGNSGGALLNASGQVIGINSMKISQAAVEGMGFAIPSNEVVKIVNELEKNGEVTRPVLGISMYNMTNVSESVASRLGLPTNLGGGVLLTAIQSGSSADQAGLQQYDVITEIDGTTIETVTNLRKVLYSHSIGDTIQITYYRGTQKQTTTVTLEASQKPSL